MTLAERLGYPPDTRLVIVSCDDLGACHALTVGVYDALHRGAATSASLMVPGPWARHARDLYDGEDVGVHLTLNAELTSVRWGPITQAPSLLDGDGAFPRTIDDLWEHADPDEVRRECRAQLERAVEWGIDVTHLAPHLSAMALRPEFFDIYLELADVHRLPVRLPSSVSEQDIGFPFRTLAAAEGVLFPDHFDAAWRPGSRQRVLRQLADLGPGVTEVHVQPAIDTPEVRALSADAEGWIDDHAFVTGGELRDAIRASGAVPIGYRQLRDAMRDV